jgi:hypothetical protein
MINLPNFESTFEYENNFYLSCDNSRIAKLLAHYELYKMVSNLPGAIVECGVFKGTSLTRFATFRDLFSNSHAKKIIGFDIYGKFPETNFEQDKAPRQRFVDSAGEEGIDVDQLKVVLQHKGVEKNVELVKGNILETVPSYINNHPELKISLLNLDTDIYEPASVILDLLFPRIVTGGVLVIDDYGVFPGETKAVDEYFQDKDVVINKFPFCMTPCYILKN